MSVAESGGILACIMDSGSIAVYDMEVAFKQVLAERVAEKRPTGPEELTDTHSRTKVCSNRYCLLLCAIGTSSFCLQIRCAAGCVHLNGAPLNYSLRTHLEQAEQTEHG